MGTVFTNVVGIGVAVVVIIGVSTGACMQPVSVVVTTIRIITARKIRDDCFIREHNRYQKIKQPFDDYDHNELHIATRPIVGNPGKPGWMGLSWSGEILSIRNISGLCPPGAGLYFSNK